MTTPRPSPACIAVLAAVASLHAQADPNRIVDAKVTDSGKVELTLQSGRRIHPIVDKEAQCQDLTISADGTMAGWFVGYNGLGPSYPIALQLTIYRVGKPARHFQSDLPMLDWSFTGNDQHVQYRYGQLHGTTRSFVEVRDIQASRLIGLWTEDPEDNSVGPVKGLVTDAKGTPLANTFASMRERPTANPLAAATSDSAGQFTIRNVEPGQYELRFERPGFKPRNLQITVAPDTQALDVGVIKLEAQPSTRK